MKKLYILSGLTAVAALSFSFADYNSSEIEDMRAYYGHRRAAGADAGYTGAPGEQNCTFCHSGSVQSGTPNSLVISDNNGPIASYTPGQTYTVTVGFSTAGSKNGFETVALATANNAQAGSMVAGTGNQVKNGSGGKKYVTHTSSGNALSSWQFQWTAPATNVGPVRFYLATNQTNSSNNEGGDVIRLSQHDVNSFASLDEIEKTTFEAGYSAENNMLHISLNAVVSGAGFINVVDLSGKSVYTEQLGKITTGDSELDVRLPESLKTGIYVIHLGVDNNFASKKIAIVQ